MFYLLYVFPADDLCPEFFLHKITGGMKKKKDTNPATQSDMDLVDEANKFIHRKKIQNKVLKEIIEKLQGPSDNIINNKK